VKERDDGSLLPYSEENSFIYGNKKLLSQ